jgi:hypothetical protein
VVAAPDRRSPRLSRRDGRRMEQAFVIRDAEGFGGG